MILNGLSFLDFQLLLFTKFLRERNRIMEKITCMKLLGFNPWFSIGARFEWWWVIFGPLYFGLGNLDLQFSFTVFKFLVFTIRIFLCPKKPRLNDNMMMQSKKSIKQWRFGLRPVKTSNVSLRRGMQPCRYDLYKATERLIGSI